MKKVSYAEMAKLVNENCKDVKAGKDFWYGGAVCLYIYWKTEEARDKAIAFVHENYRTTSNYHFLIATSRMFK